MSKFACEDIVALRDDLSVLASVDRTWSDLDQNTIPDGPSDFYFHRSLPASVKRHWHRRGELLPGYIIVEFISICDGCLLVCEDSLHLVDRSLAVGDIVKRKSSDQQSGAVLSTSMKCRIRICCTLSQYRRRAGNDQLKGEGSILEVPASELRYHAAFREEDFILYQDWVGQVRSATEVVTVQLSNGNVVKLFDPPDLQQLCFDKGTRSLQHFDRLKELGYLASSARTAKVKRKCVPLLGECSPGTLISTTKTSLRRGKWLVGRYNAKIKPCGIVLDTQCVVLEVGWLFPNIFRQRRSQQVPPEFLTTEEIHSGEIVVYDRSKQTGSGLSHQLEDAAYSPDTIFGGVVRFRDNAAAAAKYGSQVIMPTSVTGDYDLNIFQVVQPITKVKVQWQDSSFSDQDAISLMSYPNVDDHDVWPGGKVSYQPDQENCDCDGVKFVRTRKVGVVQSVDAEDRVAKVRWYKDPLIEYPAEEGSYRTPLCKYGAISDRIGEVSLYELQPLAGFDICLGNMVFILPEPPQVQAVDMETYMNRQARQGNSLSTTRDSQAIQPESRSDIGLKEDEYEGEHSSFVELGIIQAMNLWGQTEASCSGVISGNGSSAPLHQTETTSSFGEVTELCLDGDIIIRLGASPDAREIKTTPERVLVIASGDTRSTDVASDWEADETDSADSEVESDSDGDDDTDESTASTGVKVEYEGVMVIGKENNVDMWETDDEDTSTDKSDSDDKSNEDMRKDQPDFSHSRLTGLPPTPIATCPAISISNYGSLPETFSIIEASAPQDHHFFNQKATLSGEQMRRVSKEYRILASSLPDGVFARSWEERLDLLRILIVGPSGTPYEFAPFVFDVTLGSLFPAHPPDIYFHSCTGNAGRVNPNLYEDGKICLSLLGTWHSERNNEAWSPSKSTLLQIIVSIMGLVLVKEPYYNEAGFEVLQGTADSLVPSAMYSEKAYILSKPFVNKALLSPLSGFEDVIQWLYIKPDGPRLLSRIIQDCQRLQSKAETRSADSNEGPNESEVGGLGANRISAGALILLQRHLNLLVNIAGFTPSD